MKTISIKRYTRSGEIELGGITYQIKIVLGIVERALGKGMTYRTSYVSTAYVNDLPYSCLTNPLHRTIHETLDERIRALKEDMAFEFEQGYLIVEGKIGEENG
jgi:hypothetical protein